MVAQSRGAGGKLSGINMSSLTTGLQKIANVARRRKGQHLIISTSIAVVSSSFRHYKVSCSHVLLSLSLSLSLFLSLSLSLSFPASVHLPRIGYSTPNFNWYGTERLIRKHLVSNGIPTYMYPQCLMSQIDTHTRAHLLTHTHTHTHTHTQGLFKWWWWYSSTKTLFPCSPLTLVWGRCE